MELKGYFITFQHVRKKEKKITTEQRTKDWFYNISGVTHVVDNPFHQQHFMNIYIYIYKMTN